MVKKLTLSEYMKLSEEERRAYHKSLEPEMEKLREKEQERTRKTMERASHYWVDKNEC